MSEHPKLSSLTPFERANNLIFSDPGCVHGGVDMTNCSACLEDAIAAAEREAFQRGQEVMRDLAAFTAAEHQWNCPKATRVRAIPILDAPPEVEEKT